KRRTALSRPVPCRLRHRGDDAHVSAAAAEVAAEVLADLVVVAGVALPDAGQAGHDLAGRAVAALQRVVVDERLLQRVQPAVRPGDAFDGRHGLAADLD